MEFTLLKRYTRAELFDELRIPDPGGGNWYTGYNRHEREWYLFPAVGSPGRTGHDYPNRWIGPHLEWFGKTNSKIGQPTIQQMTSPGTVVHLFARGDSRDPFTYFGRLRAVEVFDEKPVRVHWQLIDEDPDAPLGVPDRRTCPEGARNPSHGTRVERSAAARRQCLAHYSTKCLACGMDFPTRYGGLGEGFIHVHHLDPVAGEGERQVDPVEDLRHLCPNCHAVAHFVDPPLPIEQIRARLDLGDEWPRAT